MRLADHFASWMEAAIAVLLAVATVALVAIALLLGVLFQESRQRGVENLRSICLEEKLLHERDNGDACPTVTER